MKAFSPARKRIDVSVGESVRIIRELQEYSQNELAKLTGILRPRSRLSKMIEFGWVSSEPKSSRAP